VRKLGAKVEVVARSTLDLPVHVATLTSRNVPDKGKIGIVLQCGQHSPVEQMGGHLGRPCIEELARLDKDGECAGLLQRLVFYWIPILNIDCARHGTPGNDARRTNPNRCWFANKGPVQEGVERFFLAERDRGVDIRLMLDIHVGMWRNHNIVADLDCTPENPDMATIKLQDPDRQKPAIFAKLLELAGLREIWYNGRDVAEKKRAPEWFQDTFQCPAFTIECSTVSHFDPATRRSRPFTQESYEALGTNLGRFFAWFAGSCRT